MTMNELFAPWNVALASTCKDHLQVQCETRQEYEGLAERRREYKKALGEGEAIKALEEAAKHLSKVKRGGRE